MKSGKNQRIFYLVAVIFSVLLGLLWRSGWIPLPKWLSKYGGDAIWSMMVFYGIGFLMPKSSMRCMAWSAFSFSWAVEFSQLYRAPWIDSFRSILVGRLILGNVFHWPDLLAYAAGVLMAVGILMAVAGRTGVGAARGKML